MYTGNYMMRNMIAIIAIIGLYTVPTWTQESCMKNNTIGICVRKESCAPINDFIESLPKPLPTNYSDILRKMTCGYDELIPKFCCIITNNEVIATPIPTRMSTVTIIPTLSTMSLKPDPSKSPGPDISVVDNRVDASPEDISDHPNLNLLPTRICGPLPANDKLVGGEKTALFEHPWMALIQYDSPRTGLHFGCGASLINNRYILTAAHCVVRRDRTLIAVRLGEYNQYNETDCVIDAEGIEKCAPPVQDIQIEEIIPHPNYNARQFINDIALIRLARDVNISTVAVRAICLPSTRKLLNTTPKRLILTGWGITSTQRASDVLLQLSLPVVNNDECQKAFRRQLRINANQICAGGEQGKDSCKGDSGGPLIYTGNLFGTRSVQYGIVSAGVESCNETTRSPGIYVRVAHYMKWILDQMRP